MEKAHILKSLFTDAARCTITRGSLPANEINIPEITNRFQCWSVYGVQWKGEMVDACKLFSRFAIFLDRVSGAMSPRYQVADADAVAEDLVNRFLGSGLWQ